MISPSFQGKHAGVLEIEREGLVQKTRLFGAEHEDTLMAASNLAAPLPRRGQMAETDQLLCS